MESQAALALAVRAAAKQNPELAHAAYLASHHPPLNRDAFVAVPQRTPASSPCGLGHESPTTTHHYVEADLSMKTRALARLQDPKAKMRRLPVLQPRYSSS